MKIILDRKAVKFSTVAVVSVLSIMLLSARLSSAKDTSLLSIGNSGTAIGVSVISSSSEKDQVVEYTIPTADVIENVDGTVSVKMERAGTITENGKPALPFYTGRVAIPQGRVFVAAAAESYGVKTIKSGAKINSANGEISVGEYPEALVGPASVRVMNGVYFAEFKIYPVKFSDGTLTAAGKIRVEVKTEVEDSAAINGWRACVRNKGDIEAVATLVDNPATVLAYEVVEQKIKKSPRMAVAAAGSARGVSGIKLFDGFPQTTLPCVAGTTYDYVIISSTDLCGETENRNFGELLEMRRAQGLSSTIVLVEDIYKKYDGVDEAEKIRNFIRDAYNKWNVKYVVLGGDSTIVPARMITVTSPTHEYNIANTFKIASDRYFQCLDGEYNSNGNAEWGEPTDGDGGGDVDIYPEVYLGRLPFDSAKEVGNWITKISKYETERRKEEVDQAMRGALFIPGSVFDEYNAPLMIELIKEESFANIKSIYTNQTDNMDLFELNANKYTLVEVIDSENTAVNTCVRYPDAAMPSLVNEIPAFIFDYGQYNGAFDRECIGESMLASNEHAFYGGMFLSVCCTDYLTLDGVSLETLMFNRVFWSIFSSFYVAEPGRIGSLMYEYMAPEISKPDVRWNFFSINLLGDPAQKIYGMSPEIYLDRSSYRSDANVKIKVVYPRYAYGVENVPVSIVVSNTVGQVGAPTVISCARTEDINMATGTFVGELDLGNINPKHGETLYAFADLPVYDGELSALRSMAKIDNVPPAISEYGVTYRDDNILELRWVTDEPVTGRVSVGTSLPVNSLWKTSDTTVFSTENSVRITGLNAYTKYLTSYVVVDAAGNMSTLPVNASASEAEYPVSVTDGREMVASFDWEESADGWSVTNLHGADCWQYGQPSYMYGPSSGTRCFATVLDGEYPAGANASVVSPFFTVRSKPVITFKHWYEMQWSAQYTTLGTPSPYGDYGIVELEIGGIWTNVTYLLEGNNGAAVITGNSDGWKTAKIILPEEFGNTTFRMRLTFVSDERTFDFGHYAGWYVDDLFVADSPAGNSVGFKDCLIDDSANGNGDGGMGPGETVTVTPRIFNYGTKQLPALSGIATLLIEGESGLVTVVGETPAPVSFPILAPGDTAPAAVPLTLKVKDNAPVGVVVTIVLKLTDPSGKPYDMKNDIRIANYNAIRGVVKDANNNSTISGAQLTAEKGFSKLTTVTGTSGEFSIGGATLGEIYTVSVEKDGYISKTTVVTNGAEEIEIFLGNPDMACMADPEQLEFSLDETTTTGSGKIICSNNGSADLSVSIGVIDYSAGAANWIKFDKSLSAVVKPNGSIEWELTVNHGNLPDGEYTAKIRVTSNDRNNQFVEFPVSMIITSTTGPVDPEIETLTASLKVLSSVTANNIGVQSPAVGGISEIVVEFSYKGSALKLPVIATVTPLTTDLTIAEAPINLTTLVPMNGTAESEEITCNFADGLSSGDTVGVCVEVTSPVDLAFSTNLTFALSKYNEVSGIVRRAPISSPDVKITKDALDDGLAIPTNAIHSIVFIDCDDGNVIEKIISSPTCDYQVGLTGERYFVEVRGLTSLGQYSYPAPAYFTIEDGDQLNAEIGEYGMSFSAKATVDDSEENGGDGDGRLEAGESGKLKVRLTNIGEGLVLSNVKAELFVVEDSEFAPACMDVINGVDNTLTVYNGYTPITYTNFTISVAADAQDDATQRFCIRLEDASGMHVWYAPFSLSVEPNLLHIRGTVSFDPAIESTVATAENMARNTIKLSYNGISKTANVSGDGSYVLRELPEGADYTVELVSNLGLSYSPQNYIYTALDQNENSANFVIKPALIEITSEGGDENVKIAIPEGVSLDTNVVVRNDSGLPMTVNLSVNYLRGRYDVKKRGDNTESTFITGNVDWSKVNGLTCEIGTFDIRFKDGTSAEERSTLLSDFGLTEVVSLSTIPACAASVADGKKMSVADYRDLTEKIASDNRVLYAQPSAKMYPAALPADPMFANQWGLLNYRQSGGSYGSDINVAPVWNLTTGSEDVVVSIVDTGIYWRHPDLKDNMNWSKFESFGYFDEETPSDMNEDGYPGIKGVDDDGDRESSRWHYNVVSDKVEGPEVVPDSFDPELWEDGDYDGIPDYFQPWISGKLDAELMYGLPIFADMNGDGTPDIFEDHWPTNAPNGIADYFDDEDGDGIHNETGIDFRDEDILRAGCKQLEYEFPWKNGKKYRIIIERWPQVMVPVSEDSAMTVIKAVKEIFAGDDDENGYIDDQIGWDFGKQTGNLMDLSDNDVVRGQHGTHLAGIVGAAWNNQGIAGINKKVGILYANIARDQIKELGADADQNYYMIPAILAKAYEYSISRGAKVINTSWNPVASGLGSAGIVYEVIKSAQETNKKVLFVVAAGNSNYPDVSFNIDSDKLYPAYYASLLDNVITVGATDENGTLASFSGWGPKSVQLVAPGVNIVSTTAAGFGAMSGTSMASAFVSGAAALLWSVEPDADFRAIRNALIEGARPDPRLYGWIGSGHLDVAGAMIALYRNWLELSRITVTIPANSSVSIPVKVNGNKDLGPGEYAAEIIATSDYGTSKTTVNLTVNPAPVLSVDSVEIVSDTDNDGYAEQGETVTFKVMIKNTGKLSYVDAFGTLSGTSVSDGNDKEIGELVSGETTESYETFTAAITAIPAEFTLKLRSDYNEPVELKFKVPADNVSARYEIRGRVMDSFGDAVTNAVVEAWGADSTDYEGNRVLTDTNGLYNIRGLLPGRYKIRVLPKNLARGEITTVTVNNADSVADFTMAHAGILLSTNMVTSAVSRRFSDSMELVISNIVGGASEAYKYVPMLMPQRKIMLLSDGPSTLNVLKKPLEQMGFEVGMYTNNYSFYYYSQKLVENVKYSDNDSNFAGYDFVIADLSGVNGSGRTMFGYEKTAFANYVARGGRVLFTGGHPFTNPDMVGLAELCGFVPDISSTLSKKETDPLVADMTGKFITLSAGDVLGTSGDVVDLFGPSTANTLITTENVPKLTENSGLGGKVYYWQDNAAAVDWSDNGIYLDVLRNILAETFYSPVATQTEVPWLAVNAGSGSIASDSSDTIGLVFNGTKLTKQGEYNAVLALVGSSSNGEVISVPVKLNVEPLKLRAYTSGSVKDWRGNPIRGDGSSDSPLFQVIYAGPDGTNDPPDTATGAPGNDDVLLAVYPSGEAYGRFGCGGVVSNTGRFAESFAYDIPVGTSNACIYVRAWDSSSFASSLVWGDSDVKHTLDYSAGESADFGSWSLTNIVNELSDFNGDTIPDGWIIRNRPDLDPRAPVSALSSKAVAFDETRLIKYSKDPQPIRVGIVKQRDYVTQIRTNWLDRLNNTNCSAVIGLSTNDITFAFALDQANSRIQILNTNDASREVWFDASALGCGKFSGPYGMDIAFRTNRMAVADTGNNRVLVFDYEFDPGETNSVVPPVPGYNFKFVSQIGSGTAAHGTNTLDHPNYAALGREANPRVYVADVGHENNRIAWFRGNDGSYVGEFQKDENGKAQVIGPQGVVLDPAGGIWVSLASSDSSKPDRIVRFSSTGSTVLNTIGENGSADGQFETPTDVKIWDTYGVRRLVVADTVNNRVQIFSMDGRHLLSFGSTKGGNDSAFGSLKFPRGTFPMTNESVIAVADTGNGRIGWYDIVLDEDGDGINDIWENKYGISATENSFATDTDGDGLSDYAESIIGTDPTLEDTDGDGYNDGWEVANGFDPLEPKSPNEEIVMLEVNTVTASKNMISAGETVEIIVNYSGAVDADSTVKAVLSGAVDVELILARVSENVYSGSYTATASDNGAVTVMVSGAKDSEGYWQNPPLKRIENLFTISYVNSAVQSLTASPAMASAGDSVIFTVVFTKEVADGDVALALSGVFATNVTAMTRVSRTTYKFECKVPVSTEDGFVSAIVSGAVDASSGESVSSFNAENALEITSGEIPEEPFPITMINSDTLGTIRITWQTEEGGVYQVETNANLLTPDAWGSFESERAATGTSDSVDVERNGLPDSMFFRVKRIR